MNRETLGQSLQPLLRWWWLIVAAAAVAGATSLLYVRMRPDIYQSHATLVVGSAMRNLNPDTMQLQLGASLARSYTDMARRSTIQDATKAALNMVWLPEYAVQANPESQAIELTVTDSDPVRAQVVAAELVRQLVKLSPGGADAENRSRFAQEQLSKMEVDISATETDVANRQDQLAKATSARQIVSLEGEISALETKLGSLRNSYIALLSSTRDGAVNAINVLEAPNLPTQPEDSNNLMLVLLATIMGGILATAGAYLLDFLDDSITLPDQAEESLGLAMLGTIPEMSAEGGGSPGQMLVMRSNPHTVAAEAFRVLRANVLFASVDAPVHVLQITSPSPGDDKSSIAANLAIAMAQTGKRVILLDGDLRRPELHRLFELRNNHGVTTALIGDDHALATALQATATPGLSVLTSGPLPPNPAELLGSRRMIALLETLKGVCDLLIVDSPPVSAVADTAVLASQADAVILVLWTGRTGRQQARYAVNALRNAHARVLGVVLNGVSRSTSGYPFYHAVERYAEYGVIRARTATVPPAPLTKGKHTHTAQDTMNPPHGFDLVGRRRMDVASPPNPLAGQPQNGQQQVGQARNGHSLDGQPQNGQQQAGQARNGHSLDGQPLNGQSVEGGRL